MPFSFTVAEFARALGVDDDGDRWRDALVPGREDLWWGMVQELVLYHPDVTRQKEMWAFMAELARLHLPAIVRALLAVPDKARATHGIVGLLSMLCRPGTYGRFLRARPTVATALCLRLLSWASSECKAVSPTFFDPARFVREIDSLCGVTALLNLLEETVVVVNGAGTRLPWAVVKPLRDLLELCHHPAAATAEETSSPFRFFEDPVKMAVMHLTVILTHCGHLKHTSGGLPGGWTRKSCSRAPWISCQASLYPNLTLCTSTTQFNELTLAYSGLSMCAKCRMVGYCSKRHQREDWKRHKHECFGPTWWDDPNGVFPEEEKVGRR